MKRSWRKNKQGKLLKMLPIFIWTSLFCSLSEKCLLLVNRISFTTLHKRLIFDLQNQESVIYYTHISEILSTGSVSLTHTSSHIHQHSHTSPLQTKATLHIFLMATGKRLSYWATSWWPYEEFYCSNKRRDGIWCMSHKHDIMTCSLSLSFSHTDKHNRFGLQPSRQRWWYSTFSHNPMFLINVIIASMCCN